MDNVPHSYVNLSECSCVSPPRPRALGPISADPLRRTYVRRVGKSHAGRLRAN